MRSALVLLMIAALTGCGVELLTTTAIQGELQAEQLKAVKGQVGRATETTGKINLQRALDTYHAEKGAYPRSLQELAPDFIASVPTQADGTPYGYDPSSGRLLDTATAAAATMLGPTDDQKMAQIREAIDKFGKTVRYYPGSLQALVPTYLPSLPKASNGMDFIYNPQNGTLTNPAQPMQQPAGQPPTVARRPAAAGGVGGGGGPMGEVMTGIGISNQLDSMSNAGSASAGSYARGKLQSSQEQHNQQQERALQDLGN
ncbi:MAG: hypothetical protein HZB26_09350 [Candidatus Hydrogenedentes bacterium]|nr:hypothetical protein [Candidatus Hydrogenedentota bacterium]